MASYDSAFNFVLPLEDTHPSGLTTHDSDGATRYGILDRIHPDLVQKGFYTAPIHQALPMAQECYRTEYWNRIHGDFITSNKVGAQIFSVAVNQGVVAAIKLAQSALSITSDGIFGPATLASINGTTEADFISKYNAAAKARYDAIIVAHPEKAKYRHGWYNRIDAISSFQG